MARAVEVVATDGSCHLEVAAGWEVSAPPPGAVLVAVEPPTGGFCCNVVVTRDPLGTADETMDVTAQRQLRDLATTLTGYLPVQIALGRAELEVRGLHVADGTGLALCQWARPAGDGTLLVLSVTLASLDLPALTGTVDAIAASWRVTP